MVQIIKNMAYRSRETVEGKEEGIALRNCGSNKKSLSRRTGRKHEKV
jgi:hypothetical protein